MDRIEYIKELIESESIRKLIDNSCLLSFVVACEVKCSPLTSYSGFIYVPRINCITYELSELRLTTTAKTRYHYSCKASMIACGCIIVIYPLIVIRLGSLVCRSMPIVLPEIKTAAQRIITIDSFYIS